MQPSLLTRLRWRLEELAEVQDAKVVVALLGLVALVLGGFFVARSVGHAASAAPTGHGLRVVTLRQRVPVRVDGAVMSGPRLRTVYAAAGTGGRIRTIRTPGGIRVVTRPVARYRIVYRKHLVRVGGETRTVLQPETSTLTRTSTQVATVTRPITVTRTVTVPATATIVSTVTVTAPSVTVTVTLPTTTLLGG